MALHGRTPAKLSAQFCGFGQSAGRANKACATRVVQPYLRYAPRMTIEPMPSISWPLGKAVVVGNLNVIGAAVTSAASSRSTALSTRHVADVSLEDDVARLPR